MLLSVIVLNYQARELLRLCLQSLTDHLSLDHEVIVVDSQAQPETEEMISEEWPAIIYLPRLENTGYAAGVNLGIAQARGRYFLILNPDVVITKQAVETLLSFFQKDLSLGLVGPRLLAFNQQAQNSCFRFYRPSTIVFRRSWLGKLPGGQKALKRFSYQDQTNREENAPREVDWLMGSALLTSREAWKKVGGLDERFFLYFEDVDWAKRFWENGYKVVYFPEAVMYHYHQKNSQGGGGVFDLFFKRESRWHLQSGLKYFLKHGWRYRSGPELRSQNS